MRNESHQQQQLQQKQQQRRRGTLRRSLCILSISCSSLTTSESFNPTAVQSFKSNQSQNHANYNHDSNYMYNYNHPFRVCSRVQVHMPHPQPLHAKLSSLPEASSSRNERNNKGKPKPLDLRRSRKKTALKATGATSAKLNKRSSTPTSTSTAASLATATKLAASTKLATANMAKSRSKRTSTSLEATRISSLPTTRSIATTRSKTTSKSTLAARRRPNTSPNTFISHNVRAKRSEGRTTAGAWYQRDEMMQHDILTREDEVLLGNKIVRAKELRDQMISFIEERKLDQMDSGGSYSSNKNLDLKWEINNNTNGISDDSADGLVNGNEYEQDYDGIGMGLGGSNGNSNSILGQEFDDDDYDDYDYENNREYNGVPGANFPSFRYDDTSHSSFRKDHRTSSTLVQDGSKLIASSFDADLILLSESDIQNSFNIKGGRRELRKILHDGARARTMLMRSNIRLVVSVGKKWMGNSKDNGGIADRYNGSWDRPSLDEVIQEGMLGLARAVDKYDPDRGLRFSTYSTHWITSYVRQCFQSAATGCLKVPSQLHDIKSSYKSIIRRHIEASESIPTEEQIASEIGVSLARLRTAIKVTESLLSVDEPVYTGGNAAFKGSGAGGDLSGENSLLISDRLESSEIAPEDYVETGFLRQTLENAMAAELSPYERDILRLRLGLDDGQTRTVKQVVEECGGDISVAEVRSAERRAFKKLRSPNAVHAHNLVAYLEMADIDVETFEQGW